jgi:hypothetical protein
MGYHTALSQTMILLIATSQVAGITGIATTISKKRPLTKQKAGLRGH